MMVKHINKYVEIMNYYTYLTSMQKYLNRIIDLNIKTKW